MYSDKVITIGHKSFEVKAAWYTGGGIYWYAGKFKDGNWFMYADTEEAATIVDDDPLRPNPDYDFDGFSPEWTEEHYVASTDYYFPITLLKKCIKEKDRPEIEIWENEAKDRIQEQKDHLKWIATTL